MALPFVYSTLGHLKGPDYFNGVEQDTREALSLFKRGDRTAIFSGLRKIGKSMMDKTTADRRSKTANFSAANVVSWSGCKDEQTSADAVEDGKPTGALTWSMVKTLSAFYLLLSRTLNDD